MLESYSDSLRTLKIGNNKIKSLGAVLDFVGKMKCLSKLDLTDNEVTKDEDYQTKVLALMKKNQVDPETRVILDGHDEDNISVSDDSEDDSEMDEEGEMEMMDNELFANMDPETRKKFEAGEISLEELEKMGIMAFDDEYGEEGEHEQDESDEEGGEKKPKQE